MLLEPDGDVMGEMVAGRSQRWPEKRNWMHAGGRGRRKPGTTRLRMMMHGLLLMFMSWMNHEQALAVVGEELGDVGQLVLHRAVHEQGLGDVGVVAAAAEPDLGRAAVAFRGVVTGREIRMRMLVDVWVVNA